MVGGTAESCHEHIESGEEATIDAAYDTKKDEWQQLKAVPAAGVRNLIQDDFSSMERVQCLQRKGSHHGTDERLPHGLVGKVIRELFQGEDDSSNGCAECNRYTCGSCGRKDFAFARFVVVERLNRLHNEICTAASHMYQGPFFTKPKARGNRKALHQSVWGNVEKDVPYQTQRFDSQRPPAHESAHDEATEDCLDFRDPTMFSISCIVLDQNRCTNSKQNLPG